MQSLLPPIRTFPQALLFSLLLSGLLACADSSLEDDVSLRLTQKERRMIDTLVSQEVQVLRPLYDSLCQTNFEQAVADATDSIVQRRLEDELRLRSRVPLRKNTVE